MSKLMLTVGLVALLAAAPAIAGDDLDSGDAARGAAFAQRTCAECHAVLSDESYSPNPDAPPFELIAGTDGMTHRALIVWLQSSHPTMPNIMLSADDRDDVVAYIMSLRQPKRK